MGQEGICGSSFVLGSAQFAASLCALTLEMITYKSEWSVQAHLNSCSSLLHKQKRILQAAFHKHNA